MLKLLGGRGVMGSLVIGRDGSCDVVLDDSSVSRWHVKLDLDDEGICLLTDLGSTNGTYVFRDSEPVGVLEAFVTLADRIKIGKCVKAKFRRVAKDYALSYDGLDGLMWQSFARDIESIAEGAS